jgi:SagB-type dehydrogenase family enzyme
VSDAAVRRYHDLSTHRPGRYAPGPGALDWASQPDPFRAYAGAERLELPLAGTDLAASWGEIHRPGSVASRPLDRSSLGSFLELGLGITAWKEHGRARWALRANPSSGNLHPTEGYVLLPPGRGTPAGLHHYAPRDHALERRWAPGSGGEALLARLLPTGAFVAGLSSIHWREAWKYGARAFRYCQHDVGHALGSLRYAAAVLGWEARLVEAPGEDDVAALLGLDREDDHAALSPADREHPDALVVVGPRGGLDEAARRLEDGLDALRAAVREGHWTGVPNRLSPTHVEWPAIDDVARATAKPRTALAGAGTPSFDRPEALVGPGDARAAAALVRGRRSAVAMDGATGLEATAFFALLDRLAPRPGVPPFDTMAGPPRVHPVLFVHRVAGVAPGLYLLPRAPDAAARLREAVRPGFAWTPAPGGPGPVPLLLLEEGDARAFARFASCHQEIAADSAFAVAMLAELDGLDESAWIYRRRHWEAGLVGQALYLEAEAASRRGTGIGCFFDDVVHETLGLRDGRLRDLYHFTVGGPVEDPRLATLPGYPERRRSP